MQYLSLLPFLAIVLAVSTTGAMFRPGPWYMALRKPSWTPPGWLFGPVWAVVYTLIAIAGWLVWRAEDFGPVLAIWGLQLVLNCAWSWIMFGRKQIGMALADICLLWTTVLAFIILARPLDPTASLLFLPYLAWGTFAGALNFTIWRLNRGATVTA